MAGGARTADIAQGAARAEIILRVEAARGALRTIEAAQRIRAEIVAVNDDGTITVRTVNGGEADLRLPPRIKLNVQVGQTVELDLPAGQPPRQVTLRAVAPAPVEAQIEMRPSAPLQPPPQAPAQSPPPAPLSPPLRTTVDAARQEMEKPPASLPAPGLPTGATIRLSPLPAPALERLVTLSPQIVETIVPVRGPATIAIIDAPAPPAGTLTTPTPLPLLEKAATLSSLWPGMPLRPEQTNSMNAIERPILTLPLRMVALVRPLDFTAPAPLQVQSGGVDVRIETVRPASGPSWFTPGPVPDKPANTPSLRGEVIAVTTDYRPVLRIERGGGVQEFFLMQFPTRGAVEGMSITFHPLPTAAPLPTPPTTAPITPQQAALTLMQGWSWPAMEDLLQALPPATAAGTAPAATALLPNPAHPGRMPAVMMFFMAALRGADAGTWLGEGIQSLLRREASGRGADILARIARDFTGLSRIADQPATQDWRGMALPLFWQGEVQKINLHYRHQHNRDDDDDPQNPDRRSTRFIFDLHLDRMGDVQLDGLMKGKRLDLVLRTQQPLSPPLCAAMRRSCRTALDSGGLEGELHFQGSPGHFVKVTARQPGLGVSA